MFDLTLQTLLTKVCPPKIQKLIFEKFLVKQLELFYKSSDLFRVLKTSLLQKIGENFIQTRELQFKENNQNFNVFKLSSNHR